MTSNQGGEQLTMTEKGLNSPTEFDFGAQLLFVRKPSPSSFSHPTHLLSPRFIGIPSQLPLLSLRKNTRTLSPLYCLSPLSLGVLYAFSHTCVSQTDRQLFFYPGPGAWHPNLGISEVSQTRHIQS